MQGFGYYFVQDTYAILNAIEKSGVKYRKAEIEGTFPMSDKFGNDLGAVVVYRVSFTRDTAQRVNYDDVVVTSWDNMESLADGLVFLHPAFRD